MTILSTFEDLAAYVAANELAGTPWQQARALAAQIDYECSSELMQAVDERAELLRDRRVAEAYDEAYEAEREHKAGLSRAELRTDDTTGVELLKEGGRWPSEDESNYCEEAWIELIHEAITAQTAPAPALKGQYQI